LRTNIERLILRTNIAIYIEDTHGALSKK